jgi:rubrerythrin
MSDKPSYLGLLNAIAQGEARGHALFQAWAAATQDADLARLLDMVAIRECEHAAAFTKRLCELGYAVQERPDPQFDIRLALLQSERSDKEKFERAFGYPKHAADPALSRIFEDSTIDIATGELLGRFIAEERDTVRRLQAAYETLTARAAEAADLAQITARLERLTRTVDSLKAQRRGG